MTCAVCGAGPIFAGNIDNHGHIEDIYHECACPPPPDDEDYDDSWVPGTAWEDFQPGRIAALYRAA